MRDIYEVDARAPADRRRPIGSRRSTSCCRIRSLPRARCSIKSRAFWFDKTAPHHRQSSWRNSPSRMSSAIRPNARTSCAAARWWSSRLQGAADRGGRARLSDRLRTTRIITRTARFAASPCRPDCISRIACRRRYSRPRRRRRPDITTRTSISSRSCGWSAVTLRDEIRRISLELYRFAAAHARARKIIIADTKFEFGLDTRRALDSDRRGFDAGFIAILAGGLVPARHQSAELRQAIRARLSGVPALEQEAAGAALAAGDRGAHQRQLSARR